MDPSDEHEAEWCSKCSSPVFSLGTMFRTTTVVQYTTVACPVRSQENRDSSGGGGGGKGKRHKKEEEEQRLDQATKFDASREREEEKVNGGEKKAPFSE